MKKLSTMILFLITASLMLSNARQEIFLKAQSEDACPSNKSCDTLSSVTVNSSTTLLFLGGTHYSNNVSWTGLYNVTLRAYQEADVTIECKSQTKLQFSNMTHLRIEGIVFSKCGLTNNPPGVLLNNINNGYFQNVQVTRSYSGALQVTSSLVSFVNFTIDKNNINATNKETFSGLNLINSQVLMTGTVIIAENVLLKNEMELNCGEGKYRYIHNDYVIVRATNSTLKISGTIKVRENTSPSGIINFVNSTFEMTKLSVFEHNTVCIEGALSLFEHSNAILNGEIKFLNNSASNEYFAGMLPVGALSMRDSNLHMQGDIVFSGNKGDIATIETYTSNISIHGCLLYEKNVADYSGTMLRSKSSMTVNGTTTIKDNILNNAALRLEASNFTSYGEIYLLGQTKYPPCRGIERSNFYFNDYTIFQNNPGVAMLRDSSMTFKGSTTFRENNVKDFTVGGGIVLKGRSLLKLSGHYLFERNRLRDIDGGAIYSDRGEIIFEGNGEFVENSAMRGGAIYLQDKARMKLGPGTNLSFVRNSATKGGAIYLYTQVERIHCISETESEVTNDCFVDLHTHKHNYTVIFKDNNSTKGASILHINFVENVDLQKQRINSTIISELTQTTSTGNKPPIIASDSFQLCFCTHSETNCTVKEKQYHVSKGEKIQVGVRALTLIPTKTLRLRSYLQSSVNSSDQSLDGDIQHLGRGCTTLTYRTTSTGTEENMIICPNDSCEEVTDSKLMLHIVFQDCPLGFALTQNKTMCTCDERILQNKTDVCNVDTNTITKTHENFWIGTNTKEPANSLSFYSVCPLNYCHPPPVKVDPTHPDTQCANRRSGTLCGGCTQNTSLALGSSNCIECSNSFHLFLIIPFAILGVLLVTFIFITQLTISNGTIHGLILYASIFNANATMFRLQELQGINVIIEWLNLNLGIETCFYKGLDQLQYTAWQFAFPFYLWLLVLVVIIVCRFSVRVSRFFSTSNPVGVLATVIFLSYTKILQNIIVILTGIERDYPPNNAHPVWKYDGNVIFGKEGHGVLMVFGVAFLVLLFLPYTLVLAGSPVLEKSEHISKLLNRLRLVPFVRAFQAPYKPAVRCWVGLCQLLKGTILIALAAGGHKNAGLLATSTICIVLISIIGACRGIYTKKWLNILEIAHILNLGLLTAVIYHLNLSYKPHERNTGMKVIGYISVIIATVIFIGTTIKQCHYRFTNTHWCTKYRERLVRKKSMDQESKELEMSEINGTLKRQSIARSQEVCIKDSKLFSELREPMLDY